MVLHSNTYTRSDTDRKGDILDLFGMCCFGGDGAVSAGDMRLYTACRIIHTLQD